MSRQATSGEVSHKGLAIGVDFDGVICDTGAYKARRARELGICARLPRDFTNRTACERLLGTDAYNAISHEAYCETTTLRLPPVRGATKGLYELRSMGEIYVLTARSGRWLRPCMAWLARRRIGAMVTGVISCPTRGQKFSEVRRRGIIALLDDDERHLRGSALPRTIKVLFRIRPNAQREDISELDWDGFVRLVRCRVRLGAGSQRKP